MPKQIFQRPAPVPRGNQPKVGNSFGQQNWGRKKNAPVAGLPKAGRPQADKPAGSQRSHTKSDD